jgi:death on curing protein
MTAINFLTTEMVLDAHAKQLAIFGGGSGLRDEGLLESAVARAENKFAYGETDLAALAAAYVFGIARNHPFIDGNKRAAFAALIMFLWINGIVFRVEPAQATLAILGTAAGEISEDGLARWIRDNLPKAP